MWILYHFELLLEQKLFTYFLHIYTYLLQPDPLVYPSIEILWRLKSEALL